MQMNLPNKLTLLRVIMAPIAMVFILYPIGGEIVARIIAAVLFVLTALTDMLDGKIARKYNLITDFGKFLDPLADKFMVIGAMFVILYKFDNLRECGVLADLLGADLDISAPQGADRADSRADRLFDRDALAADGRFVGRALTLDNDGVNGYSLARLDLDNITYGDLGERKSNKLSVAKDGRALGHH